MSLVAGLASPETARIFSVSFLVLASKVIRPGHVYRLSVTNQGSQPVSAHASILRDGLDIASAEQLCSSGVPELIMLRVPAQALEGAYKLKVEGRTEADELVFSNETSLEFSQRSITILVQTDRPVYHQSQVVRFRTIPVSTDLRPFSEALDVFVLDPNGLLVRRWLSKQTNLGAVSLEFALSERPVPGRWTVRVLAQGQLQSAHFQVEQFEEQQFEVQVSLAGELLETDEFVAGFIAANYTNGAPVRGNLTVVISAELAGLTGSTSETEAHFAGYTDFRYRLADLRRLLASQRLEGARITVSAYVGEQFLEATQSGFASALIGASRLRLRLVGPSVLVFKPQLGFEAHLAVSRENGAPLGAEQLATGALEVRLWLVGRFGSQPLANRSLELSSSAPGTWRLAVDARPLLAGRQSLAELEHLRLEAAYLEGGRARASVQARAYPAHAPTGRALQVSTSTGRARVGDYAVFHLAANYRLELVSYLLLSKGLVLAAGRERVRSSPTTFAVPVSAEMVPSCSLLVFDLAGSGELLLDMLTFHVAAGRSHNVSLLLNPLKDKQGELLEVGVFGEPGTYVGLSAASEELGAGQLLGAAELERHLQHFDHQLAPLEHSWLLAGGAAETLRFAAPARAPDAHGLLEEAGLVAFTDAQVARRSWLVCAPGLARCQLAERCYNASASRCNGRDDCGDGSDEADCDQVAATPPRLANRLRRHFADNWLWRDLHLGPLGHYRFEAHLPALAAHWQVGALSVSPGRGVGVLAEPAAVSSARPFRLQLELPASCNRGEQVAARAVLTNLRADELEVSLSLAASPDYKFVHVPPSGQVSAYAPPTSFGEHQHLVLVGGRRSVSVHLPLVAQRVGPVNVTVSATSQLARKTLSRTLRVRPDGVAQRSHASLVLDLTQGSYLLRHLDTNLTESPLVMYDKVRRYIFGSNRAELVVSGGVVGPLVGVSGALDTRSLLQLPAESGEQLAFEFALNLLAVSYLRRTGQDSAELRRDTFKHLNRLYQRLLAFRSGDGSFRMFLSSREPSVWLTALVARHLHLASAQEWDNYIQVDASLVEGALGWLAARQTAEGAFVEAAPFAHDRKLEGTEARLRHAPLTAFVLIALQALRERPGEQAAAASQARALAQRHLEALVQRPGRLASQRDPFELAIVAYALQLAGSLDADEAHEQLNLQLRHQSGLRYWAREPAAPPTQPAAGQASRPLTAPRPRGRWDARSVQASAYGLLAQVQRQSPLQRDVADWLNLQRLSPAGWASTQDTLVALEALVAHSLGADQRALTDLKVTLEAPALRQHWERRAQLAEANLSRAHSFQLADAHGILAVKAEGSGLALVSLDVHYNVDWAQLQVPPPLACFELDVRPTYAGRNSSSLQLEACARWTLTSESARSGMAVLEVPLPTGYTVSQAALDLMVNASSAAHATSLGQPRTLREARLAERQVFFFFDYIDDKRTCVQFTMHRRFPVANMSRFMAVKVYDYYAPERFNETMLNAYNLHALSICHVCGSYQCPYCPDYSGASRPPVQVHLLLLGLLLSLLLAWLAGALAAGRPFK